MKGKIINISGRCLCFLAILIANLSSFMLGGEIDLPTILDNTDSDI